ATRFFAFFTIQSNLIGVAAFAWVLLNGDKARSRGLELLRGASAVYLTVTFFVVIFLLSNVDVQLQLPWVDFVLHKLFPVIVVLDWIVDPPRVRLTYRDALIWIVYPLVWTGLTLVRGAADGWYPYPFLDPANGGYGQVAITAVAVTIGFLLIAVAWIYVGNARSRAGQRVQPAT
ncbi:MAG: Pr6Pr family membrane protein, partial [Chloroflexi bacterium]|nr:Pr6Pr family membrane protein [Chloroflexota bacterium]